MRIAVLVAAAAASCALPAPVPDDGGAVFDRDDYRLGALLSLAGPPGVMLLADTTG